MLTLDPESIELRIKNGGLYIVALYISGRERGGLHGGGGRWWVDRISIVFFFDSLIIPNNC